jgi:phospholipid/cholesterol/gamma-HCH transport system substrate-binding protein
MPRNVQFKVGLFIVATTLLIASSLGYVAYKKGFFSKEHIFSLSSKSGENLTEGMPVVFSGFKIGRVHTIELNSEGIVMIQIKVPDRHVKWIRTDSVFVLEKPLIGSARINVTTANLNAAPLSDKIVPRVIEANDINETLQNIRPIIEKINKITDNVDRITSDFSNPRGDLSRILSNARDITQQAGAILKKVDAMAAKTDQGIYGPDGLLPAVRTILVDLIVKLRKLDPAFAHVTKITGEAAESTQDLKILRREIDETVDAINGLVHDIDSLIPLKKEDRIKLP